MVSNLFPLGVTIEQTQSSGVKARSSGISGPGIGLPAEICCRTQWSNRKLFDSRTISGSRMVRDPVSGEKYQWRISDPPSQTPLERLSPKMMPTTRHMVRIFIFAGSQRFSSQILQKHEWGLEERILTESRGLLIRLSLHLLVWFLNGLSMLPVERLGMRI